MTDTIKINQYDDFRPLDRAETLAQIRTRNVLAMSGGRVQTLRNSQDEPVGLRFPVGAGYRVDVLLDPSDTYTVRRVFARAGKEWIKGQIEDVYCTEVGETCWVASCYVNRSFGDDMRDGDH